MYKFNFINILLINYVIYAVKTDPDVNDNDITDINDTKLLKYFECSDSRVCHKIDINRECFKVTNQCECRVGYYTDPKDGLKCIKLANTECNDSQRFDNWPSNQVCYDNRCQFAPNYRFSDTINDTINFKCSYESDCQVYDESRECDTSVHQCRCPYNFYADNNNGLKCKRFDDNYCNKYQQCSDWPNHQVCYANRCQFAPNYKFDEIKNDTAYYSCLNDYDCQQYDRLRQCNHYGKCICREGTNEDPDNGYKCTGDGHYVDNICNTDKECRIDPKSDTVYCIDNRCRCAINRFPNYVMNTRVCQLNNCNKTYECQNYDMNKECIDGNCECSVGYYPHLLLPHKCFRVDSVYCDNSISCSYWPSNQFCYDNRCRFIPNYRFSSQYNDTIPTVCDDNRDCQSYDLNRECNHYSKRCECMGEDGYEDNNYICQRYRNNGSNYNIAIVSIITVASTVITLCFLMLGIRVYKKSLKNTMGQTSTTASTTTTTTTTTDITNNIQTIEQQLQLSSDKPPDYDTCAQPSAPSSSPPPPAYRSLNFNQ